MKALILTEDLNIRLVEMEEPELKAGYVIIDVKACGICGTDMHVYKGMASNWSLPGIIGHEFAGVVCACAGDVKDYKPGDRVTAQPLLNCGKCATCREGRTNLCTGIRLIGGEYPGAFAEKVAVPADKLIKVPDRIPLEKAALSEPLATVIHGLGRLKKQRYESVLILGAGALGLLALQMLRDRAENIAISDVSEVRLKVAKALGATCTINAARQEVEKEVLEMTKGGRIDLAIDAAGFSSTRQQAFQLIKPGGELLFIALGQKETPVDFMQLVTSELSMYGTQCHTMEDFHLAIEAMDKIDYDKIVTQFPLEQGEEAFKKLREDPGYGIKLHLVP